MTQKINLSVDDVADVNFINDFCDSQSYDSNVDGTKTEFIKAEIIRFLAGKVNNHRERLAHEAADWTDAIGSIS